MQPSLFEVSERVRSPICCYEAHCGFYATLSQPIEKAEKHQPRDSLRALRAIGDREHEQNPALGFGFRFRAEGRRTPKGETDAIV